MTEETETMSEQDLTNLTNTASSESNTPNDDHVLAKLILEIQQTPEEYLPNLLQIVRLFRESVTREAVRLQASEEKSTPETLEANRLTQQHKALKELTKEWMEEGDEEEQTETWEYLRQALEENPVSI